MRSHSAWRVSLAVYTAYSLFLVAFNWHRGSLDALLLGATGWGLQAAAWVLLQAAAALGSRDRLAAAADRLRSHRGALTLAAILALALALRIAGLGAGPPNAGQIDEGRYVQEAVRMIESSTLDHRNYEHGAIPYWIQMAASAVYFVRSQAERGGRSIESLPEEGHLLYGRAAMAAVGALTVAALYWASLPLLGRRWALGAALVLAADAVHIGHGRTVHDDIPAALFLTLACGLVFRLWIGKWGRAGSAAAGIVSGIAIAAKYYNLPVVLPLAIAAHRRGRQRGDPGACLAAALSLVPAGFFLGTPYTVIRFGRFLGELKDLNLSTYTEAKGAALVGFLGPSVWMGLGPVLAIVFAAGLVARLSPPAPRDWLLLAFPLALVALLGSFHRIFGRYLVPLHPFLAILTVDSLRAGSAWLAERRPERGRSAAIACAALLAGGAAWPAAASLVQLEEERTAPRQADLAAEWIRENTPPGSCVIVESVAKIDVPPGAVRVEAVEKLVDLTVESIASRGCRYAIASAANYRKPRLRARYERLAPSLTLIREFSAKAEPPGGEPFRAAGPPIRIYAVTAAPAGP